MKQLFYSVMLVLFTSACLAQLSPEIDEYYQRWVGCKAPPLTFGKGDMMEAADQSYAGKRLLLYSFDSGDFVDSTDKEVLLAELRSFEEVRQENEDYPKVIGYTRGPMFFPWFTGHPVPHELAELTPFPIVNLNNKRSTNSLPEPYQLLKRPGAILIGTNGLICGIYWHPMSKKDFLDAHSTSAWQGPSKEPPQLTAQQVWKEIPKVKVVVSRNNTPSDTVLSRRYICIGEISHRAMTPAHIPASNIEELYGRIITKDLERGEPVTVNVVEAEEDPTSP